MSASEEAPRDSTGKCSKGELAEPFSIGKPLSTGRFYPDS